MAQHQMPLLSRSNFNPEFFKCTITQTRWR
ncbi:hypothetical protein ACVNPZ_04915 [Staphylococcus aureus]